MAFMLKVFPSLSMILGITLLSGSLISNYGAYLLLNMSEMLIEWELISPGSCGVSLVFILDFMSLYFMSLVSLVSGSVMIFSSSYMSAEIFFGRFIGLVFSFVTSMFLLILSPNLISLMLGWDGLGVTSYLLVVFYQSSKSYNAGMITAMTNRLGDVGLLVSISLLLGYGNWTYLYSSNVGASYSMVIMALIVVSACTKSAQMPFSSWLPAAMAAPTPVSALVHSSTLVTAGVYLLIRFNLLLVSFNLAFILMTVGSMTMLMAGFAAMMEMDMKKVIALSTLSQLGVMMMVIGGGMPFLAYFHLLSHAFFKAMLFMCAGMIIHNMKDYQDIRKMGTGKSFMPLILSVMMVANLSLCGLPFLSGFYSKDLILEMMLMKNANALSLAIILMGTFLTVAYSCRLTFLVANSMVSSEPMYSMNDKDIFMAAGMMFLLPWSILGGMNLSWNMMSVNSLVFLPLWMKSLIIVCIFLAIILMATYFGKLKKLSPNKMVWYLASMWFMPYTFSNLMSKSTLGYSKTFNLDVEVSWMEYILFKKSFISSENSSFSHSVDFVSYFYIMKIMGMLLILLICVYFI